MKILQQTNNVFLDYAKVKTPVSSLLAPKSTTLLIPQACCWSPQNRLGQCITCFLALNQMANWGNYMSSTSQPPKMFFWVIFAVTGHHGLKLKETKSSYLDIFRGCFDAWETFRKYHLYYIIQNQTTLLASDNLVLLRSRFFFFLFKYIRLHINKINNNKKQDSYFVTW